MAKIKLVNNTPDQEVIDALKECLKDAEEGKILEFQLSARYEGFQIFTVTSGPAKDVFVMFGALMAAALEYREKFIETED